MMVDLEAPKTKTYSEEEGKLIQGNFILLLHTLLLTYLSLHNLLIPMVANLLRGRLLFEDVHFWFLAQIPVQILLRKGKEVPRGYFVFLLLGSFTRLSYATALAPTLKSWSIMSMVLSEGASLIFYFVYATQVSLKGRVWFGAFGLFVPVLLQHMEVQSLHGPIALTSQVVVEEHRSVGCEGDKFSLSFPRPIEPTHASLRVVNCGFEKRYVRTDDSFSVRNDLPYTVNLRLYKIHVLYGRVSWRFVRLMMVESGKVVDLTPLLKSSEIYLLKSPERSALGMSILVPKSYLTFPLGTGKLNLTYDSVGWTL